MGSSAKGLLCNLDGPGISKDNNESKHLGSNYPVPGLAPIALHVLTYLILKPPHEVGTMIITLILQMEKLNSGEVHYPGPAHITN